MGSFDPAADGFQPFLEQQLTLIQAKDQANESILKQDEGEQHESEDQKRVDSYKIEAVTTCLDDFDNILAKNYCVYTNYEDFSFAQSRSKDQLDLNFAKFARANLSGDFQVQNWFNPMVLPRVQFLQARSKFIYTYKILHFNTECQLVQNAFPFPEFGRHVVSPDGQLYCTGGYFGLINHVARNTFVLDEHRFVLVPLQHMTTARADHVMLWFKGAIFALGGMGPDGAGGVRSLNSGEVYSVKDDTWRALPPFEHPRQAFGACIFNDKFVFVFGGKALRPGATMQRQEFDFVSAVEVYDVERDNWRVINYIAERERLSLLHPGTVQVTGKKIMVFGGVAPRSSDDEEGKAILDGMPVRITHHCWMLNVTNGELKRAADLPKPAYFVSGGSSFGQQGTLFAIGVGIGRENAGAL